MPEGFDFSELLKALAERAGSLDPEQFEAILATLPPEVTEAVFSAAANPEVLRGVGTAQGAIQDLQDLVAEVQESLPEVLGAGLDSVDDIRGAAEALQTQLGGVAAQGAESLRELQEGVRTAARGLDAAAVLRGLAGTLPSLGAGAARRYLSQPQAAPLRARLIGFATQAGNGKTGTGAATVALLAATQELPGFAGSAAAGAGLAKAVAMLPTEPFLAAAATVIDGFAQARGVSAEEELQAWVADAKAMTLFSGAANRYAAATGLDTLEYADRLAATQKIAQQLEDLFAGAATDWVANGSSPEMIANAVRNARGTVVRVEKIRAAAAPALAAPSEPPATKPVTRKPRSTKPRTPKGGPDAGEAPGKSL